MAYHEPNGFTARLETLERWQQQVAPMLAQLSDDQAYRARWASERSSSRARLRRTIGWVVTVAGGIVIATAAVIQIYSALH